MWKIFFCDSNSEDAHENSYRGEDYLGVIEGDMKVMEDDLRVMEDDLGVVEDDLTLMEDVLSVLKDDKEESPTTASKICENAPELEQDTIMEVEGVEDALEVIAPIYTHVLFILFIGLKEVPVKSVDDDTGSPLDEIDVSVAS